MTLAVETQSISSRHYSQFQLDIADGLFLDFEKDGAPFGIYAGNSAVAANGVQLVGRARLPNKLVLYCLVRSAKPLFGLSLLDCETVDIDSIQYRTRLLEPFHRELGRCLLFKLGHGCAQAISVAQQFVALHDVR
ncbi:hypothetical protein AJ88_35195 [Mesorhizobium amorphae CCBAU 01583]|nr:hypothetical protein AJ88_35195 [Mesorhizobium amorphae CCBAU 01583]